MSSPLPLGVLGRLGRDAVTNDVPLTALGRAPHGVLCGDAKGRLWLWTVDAGFAVRMLEGDGAPLVAVASLDWRALSIDAQGRLAQWHLEQGKILRRVEVDAGTRPLLATDREGAHIARAASDGPIVEHASKDLRELRRFGEGASALCWTDDGELLAAHGEVLCGYRDGAVFHRTVLPAPITSLGVKDFGRMLVAGLADGSVAVLRPPTKTKRPPKKPKACKTVDHYPGEHGALLAVGFLSVDAKDVVSLSADGTYRCIRRRDGKTTNTARCPRTPALAHFGGALALAVDAGVPYDLDGPFRTWAEAGEPLACDPESERWAATGHANAALLCAPDGTALASSPPRWPGQVRDLVWRDGAVLQLLSESPDGLLEITPQDVEPFEHDADSLRLTQEVLDKLSGMDALDRDTARSRGHRLVLWRWEPAAEGPGTRLFDLALDTALEAACFEGNEAAWYACGRRLARVGLEGEESVAFEAGEPVAALQAAPGGRFVAALTGEDGSLALFRADGRLVDLPETIAVSGPLRFSPDGRQLLACGEDGGRLVLCGTGDVVRLPLGPGPADFAAWAPDGRSLWVAGAGLLRRLALPARRVVEALPYRLDERNASWSGALALGQGRATLVSEDESWMFDLGAARRLPAPFGGDAPADAAAFPVVAADPLAAEQRTLADFLASGAKSLPATVERSPALLAAAALRLLASRWCPWGARFAVAESGRLEKLLRSLAKLPLVPEGAAAEALAACYALNPNRFTETADKDALGGLLRKPLAQALRAAGGGALEVWLQGRIAPAKTRPRKPAKKKPKAAPPPGLEQALERVAALLCDDYVRSWVDPAAVVPRLPRDEPQSLVVRSLDGVELGTVRRLTLDVLYSSSGGYAPRHLARGPAPSLDLTPLAGAPALEELVVHSRHARLHGVAALAELPALRILDLSHSQVEDPADFVAHCPRGIAALSLPEGLGAKHLKKLFPALAALRFLRPNKLSARALLSLAPLAGLEGLDLTAAEGNRRATLPPLPALRVLATKVGKRTQDLADTVANTPRLERLDLERASLDDLSFVRGWRDLKALNLGATEKLKDLSPLAALQALERLDLSMSYYTRDLSPLAACASLREVSLRGSGAWHLEALAACPRLERILTGTKELKIRKGKGVCLPMF